MKKMMIISLCVLVFASLGFAQAYNSGTGITGIDVLGAHNNYGRGCAGCHAPHSGYFGAGGNGITGGTYAKDTLTGSNALFAQDMGPLFNQSFTFGGGYVEAVGSNTTAYADNTEEVRGILMCLACHDGNVAKGGMMTGKLFEASYLTSGYGTPANIPTLLNNDGSAAGYSNDHPVGVAANWGKLGLSKYITPTIDAAKGITALSVTDPNYQSFIDNYGMPSIEGSQWSFGFANPDANTNAGSLFITCTTCHNQHVMYIYKAPSFPGYGANHTVTSANGIQAGGTYPTYFFINAPYNVNAANTGTDSATAPSTTQFCRQCHFGEANENFGVTSVKTKF